VHTCHLEAESRFERPVLIAPSEDHQKPAMVDAHEDLAEKIRKSPEKWSSNTVFVVDMSGSMCEDDVNGARCRSDGVWTTLAKDYVQKQLEAETCSLYDVVSVVLMRENAQVVIEYEPMDWVLYNKLVSFREVSSPPTTWHELRVGPVTSRVYILHLIGCLFLLVGCLETKGPRVLQARAGKGFGDIGYRKPRFVRPVALVFQ
jgi:hypothetical protein